LLFGEVTISDVLLLCQFGGEGAFPGAVWPTRGIRQNYFYFHKNCITSEIFGIGGTLSQEMSTEAESKEKHGV
jgi:hypothetical protein